MYSRGSMESKQKLIISWTLFFTFWVIFSLSCVGTLAMLFLGFGEVQEAERPTLINMLIGEVSVGLLALFYSVFNLKKDSLIDNDEINILKAQVASKDGEISRLKSKLEKEINRTDQFPSSKKYRDSIKGLCSPLSDTQLEDLIKKLGLDTDNMSQERQEVFAEIGLMKDEGVLINQSSLYPDAVRLNSSSE